MKTFKIRTLSQLLAKILHHVEHEIKTFSSLRQNSVNDFLGCYSTGNHFECSKGTTLICTEGALRLLMTYDNHLMHPIPSTKPP